MYLNKLLILKKLQQANTHLGLTIGRHGTRWSRFSAQRAQSYIYGFRALRGPIFDLDKTVISLRRACNVIQLIIRSNGHLLFVNTNPKYNKIIQQTAKCTNQSFINHKWIGGFLTNWNHMQNVQQQFHAAARLTRVFLRERSRTQVPIGLNSCFARPPQKPVGEGRQRFSDTRYPQPSKTWAHTEGYGVDENAAVLSCLVRPSGARRPSEPMERSKLGAESILRNPRAGEGGPHVYLNRGTFSEVNYLAIIIASDPRFKKMQKCFEGLPKLSPSTPKGIADCVIIFNANQNSTAIYEAHLNQIPIICVVDSNIPNELYNLITFPIPANSESVQFIYLFCNCILKTILVSR
jgi:ribosomal protein S2